MRLLPTTLEHIKNDKDIRKKPGRLQRYLSLQVSLLKGNPGCKVEMVSSVRDEFVPWMGYVVLETKTVGQAEAVDYTTYSLSV